MLFASWKEGSPSSESGEDKGPWFHKGYSCLPSSVFVATQKLFRTGNFYLVKIKKSENLFSETNTPLLCYYFELMNLFGGSEYALDLEMSVEVH